MRARLRTFATLRLAIASLTAGMTPVVDRGVSPVGALCAGTGHSHETPPGTRAAAIFDNLHMMHDIISDVLASDSIPREPKREVIAAQLAEQHD